MTLTKRVLGKSTSVPLSPAVKTESLVFVSGQVPLRDDGSVPESMEEQTRIVLDRVKALVEEAGSSMDRVVKTTVFITDKSEFQKMNAAYSEYFPVDPPARSTIECQLMVDIKVEIEAIALA